MNTCVDGLVKIGKTGIENFEQRMKKLENDGYRRISVLTREFAIEVDKYDEKEILLKEIFSKSRVGTSELFSVDINLVKQLMSSLDGKVIYPKDEKKEDIFTQATEEVEVKKGIIPDGKYYLKTKIKKSSCYAEATMVVENGKIYIESGAKLAPITSKITKGCLTIRDKIKMNEKGTEERIECSSPSMAATIVCGHAKNGWNIWKNEDNQYIDIYRKALNIDSDEE